MDTRDWLILKTLAQKKSITKAAEALFISQPALTNRIQQIEKEFNSQIIHRTAKGVYFTSQGEILLASAIEWLSSYAQVKEQLNNLDDKLHGTLRIAASDYFSKYKLPKLLRRFSDIYPDIRFQVHTLWSENIHEKIDRQEVHVGFVRTEHGWQEGSEELFHEPLSIVSTTPLLLSELPDYPRISYRTGPMNQLLMDQWWRENYSVAPWISMEVDKADTCREMVLQGLGYAILPAMVSQTYPKLIRHTLLDKQGQPIVRKSWMIYKHEACELRIVNTFLEFVRSIDLYNL